MGLQLCRKAYLLSRFEVGITSMVTEKILRGVICL